MTEDDIQREQINAALRLLEAFHGDALERPNSDEAHAYYHAIGILEDAIEGKFISPDDYNDSERLRKDIERSRKARSEGYAEATLLNERYGPISEKPQTLLTRLHRRFFDRDGKP